MNKQELEIVRSVEFQNKMLKLQNENEKLQNQRDRNFVVGKELRARLHKSDWETMYYFLEARKIRDEFGVEFQKMEAEQAEAKINNIVKEEKFDSVDEQELVEQEEFS